MSVLSALRWISRQQRYDSDAASRWGHFYEDAVSSGLVSVGEIEVYMLGRYRDIRRPIALTDDGKKLVGHKPHQHKSGEVQEMR